MRGGEQGAGAEPGVWRNRSFRLLWAARTVSLTGSAVTLVVLPVLVFQRTGSPLHFGALPAGRIVIDIREGLRYLWQQRLVRTLTVLAFGLSVTGGAVVGLLVVYGVRALGLLWELTYTLVAVNTITIRQLVTPDRLQGRVNTTGRLLGWGLGWPVGAALGGVIADLTTVRTAYLVMAAVALAAAGGAWLSPLRHSSADAERADLPAE